MAVNPTSYDPLREPGRIPVAEVIPFIQRYLDEEAEQVERCLYEVEAIHPQVALALRVGIHEDTIRSILNGRTQTIDFDLADRMMGVMGLIDEWITSPFYQSVPLAEKPTSRYKITAKTNERRCEAVGCSNLFVPTRTSGRRQKYCSKRCCERASDQRLAIQRNGKPRYSNHLDKCPHGHDWSEENTYWFGTKKDGSKRRRCRACAIAKSAANRRKQKEQQS